MLSTHMQDSICKVFSFILPTSLFLSLELARKQVYITHTSTCYSNLLLLFFLIRAKIQSKYSKWCFLFEKEVVKLQPQWAIAPGSQSCVTDVHITEREHPKAVARICAGPIKVNLVILDHDKDGGNLLFGKEIIIPEATLKIGYNSINPKQLNVFDTNIKMNFFTASMLYTSLTITPSIE